MAQCLESDRLKAIAQFFLEYLRNLTPDQNAMLRSFVTGYHDFFKARFPNAIVREMMRSFGLSDPDDVQVELVHVRGDLRHRVHHHAVSTAYVVVLGEDDGFPDARMATYTTGQRHPLAI